MTPRWLAPCDTSSGIRARSATASGPGTAMAALRPARLNAFDADMSEMARDPAGSEATDVKVAGGVDDRCMDLVGHHPHAERLARAPAPP